MPNDPARMGFQHPVRHARPLTARKLAFAELIMTLCLVLSLAVAATAVSIGIARAACVKPAQACQLSEP